MVYNTQKQYLYFYSDKIDRNFLFS